MRIPYFEVKRMLEKAFKTLEGRHCIPTRAKRILETRYLGNDLVTLKELSEIYNMSESELLGIEMKNLNKVRNYLIRKGYADYVTELQVTV